MKPGHGNGCFIADLHLNITDEVMRERWRAGAYDTSDGRKPRADYVAGWRKLAGRN
jgi:hypothetical protein